MRMNKKLNVEWVVGNFLPDFRKRWSDYRCVEEVGMMDYEEAIDAEMNFIYDNFTEALLELLKAQRIICQDVFDSSYKAEQVEDVYFNRRIENATIPEPKNRK